MEFINILFLVIALISTFTFVHNRYSGFWKQLGMIFIILFTTKIMCMLVTVLFIFIGIRNLDILSCIGYVIYFPILYAACELVKRHIKVRGV